MVPPEKRKPGSIVKRKPKKKSKKKTKRDNVRAARFQAKKQQEKDAAAPEASKDDPLPTTSSRATGPSTFTFAEPTPENVSADSNFADMNIDGNATISAEHIVSQSDSADLSESNLTEEKKTGTWDGVSDIPFSPTRHPELAKLIAQIREQRKLPSEEVRQSSEHVERTLQPTSNKEESILNENTPPIL